MIENNQAVVRPIVCFLVVASLAVATWAGGVDAAGPSLGQRLLKTGDLAGFNRTPPTAETAYSWATKEGPGDITAEQNWLERIGFVAGATEQLSTPQVSSQAAVSFVIEFRTAAGAHADLARVLAKQKQNGAKPHSFSVVGIPGAQGLAASGELSVVAGCGCASRTVGESYEVFFDDGQFFYGVGAYAPDKGHPPTSSQVTQAALRLFQRVRGTA